MKVILSPNLCRDGDLSHTRQAMALLEAGGAHTAVCLPYPPRDGCALPADISFSCLEEEISGADVLITFGGDGTILRVSGAAAAAGVPVLGVNLGRLGFMAGLEADNLALLERLFTGEYAREEHMMLRAQVFRREELIQESTVLNDVIISRGEGSRVVDLEVWFDGVRMPRVSGDGLIAATPTGSTAYSLSAGGPVMEHTAQGIVITPVCPHSLGFRPHVTRADRVINVRLIEHSDASAVLLSDGQDALPLVGGDIVQLRRAEESFTLIRLQSEDFYQVLTEKMITL